MAGLSRPQIVHHIQVRLAHVSASAAGTGLVSVRPAIVTDAFALVSRGPNELNLS